jgi:BirA family biotin operon repressor/biotin-[acetyl-CoA-carboxylase] ligase
MKNTPLDIQQIRRRLNTEFIGQELHYFSSVGSTNVEAKRLAAAGAPAGTLVITDEQTAGKGRMGRRWEAPANNCLLMTLVFRPDLLPQQASRLMMLCSLAAAEAIEDSTGLDVRLKWPNDLVVGRTQPRKLAGALSESSLAGGRLLFAVVGLGINVNLDPAVLDSVITPATSLLAELGRPVDRNELLVAILERIETRYPQALTGEIYTGWAQKLITLGQSVTVTSPDRKIQGVAEKIDAEGTLFIRDLAGILHPIVVGDVTLRPQKDRKDT